MRIDLPHGGGGGDCMCTARATTVLRRRAQLCTSNNNRTATAPRLTTGRGTAAMTATHCPAADEGRRRRGKKSDGKRWLTEHGLRRTLTPRPTQRTAKGETGGGRISANEPPIKTLWVVDGAGARTIARSHAPPVARAAFNEPMGQPQPRLRQNTHNNTAHGDGTTHITCSGHPS